MCNTGLLWPPLNHSLRSWFKARPFEASITNFSRSYSKITLNSKFSFSIKLILMHFLCMYVSANNLTWHPFCCNLVNHICKNCIIHHLNKINHIALMHFYRIHNVNFHMEIILRSFSQIVLLRRESYISRFK